MQTARYEWIIFYRTRLKVWRSPRLFEAVKTPGLSPSSSIRFDEARVSGVREVRHSLVTAVAVVPSHGSYDQSRAEVRSKRRRVWL